MDKETRNAIERATQRVRRLLEEDFTAQLEGNFDVHLDGTMAEKPSAHLSARQAFQRDRIIASIEHKCAAGMNPADSVRDYVRDSAFTTLNRFVALKMLEARELVQECITKGEESIGYFEFCGLAPGLPLLPDSAGYRLYIESLFDELSTEVKVLFDRRDPSSVLWPKRTTFEQLLEALNTRELSGVWGEDETIGWVYQYFNGPDERRKMREESQAPRNSRELAVRNQFFTPRYVVQFLTDNTLGRIWYEMSVGKTKIADQCEHFLLEPGSELNTRDKKDPRDLRVLDPACGSGHFLLYAFDLLLHIYEEAYSDPECPKSEVTGNKLSEDYRSLDALWGAVPGLVLEHNLHGIDIDPRCVQIAQLALWLRAQRAYRDLGIDRRLRQPIKRSNIVVAEPPGLEDHIVKDFIKKLDDSELRRVFSQLIDSLGRAGELGILLRVEDLVGEKLSKGQTAHLFAASTRGLQATLEKFIEENRDISNVQKRIFKDDAIQGIGLLRIAEKKFDVILMNPPFGEVTCRCDKLLNELYPDWTSNILCGFFLRSLELATPNGLIGAIFDRTAVVKSSYEAFRRSVFVGADNISHFVDLGWSVLDANVEVACLVLDKRAPPQRGVYIDVRGVAPGLKEQRIIEAGKALKSRNRDPLVYLESSSSFSALPNAVVGYDFPVFLRKAFRCFETLEEKKLKAYQGYALKADKHFRLRWELADSTLYGFRRPLFNGAGFSPYFTNFLDYVVSPIDLPELPKDSSTRISNVSQHGKPGICFGKRGDFFTAHILPYGCVFTVEGQALPVDEPDRALELLAYLNTSLVRYALNRYCGQHKYSGYVNLLPWVPFEHPEIARELTQRAISCASLAQRHDELQSTYIGLPSGSQLSEIAEQYATLIGAADEASIKCQRWCDEELARVLDLSAEDAAIIKGFGDTEPVRKSPIEDADIETGCQIYAATSVVSHVFGCAIGRWKINYVPELIEAKTDMFAGLQLEAPASLSHLERVKSSSMTAVLVDDRGHKHDLEALIHDIISSIWSDSAEKLVRDLCDTLSVPSLRDYLVRRFFGDHLSRYSKNRRQAPIYWQLATQSSTYSVWLYAHAMNADTIFRIQNEYIGPKLAHEERRLEAMVAQLQDQVGAGQRHEVETQQEYVTELRAFFGEIKSVAPLWNPNLDDGVIINFAPLWRLVPHHKAWQKELKATWDALCEGKYDWAHLAMHLWPERVVPKCAEDRSLAIAHGLEEIFWVEGADGKWASRKSPTRTIDELVRERTSPAVKSALRSLMEAPVASGSTGRKGRNRKASAVTEGGYV